MKTLYRHLHKAPFRVVRIGRRRFMLRLRRDLLILKLALAQEKRETREMLSIYRRYTLKQASRQELREANQQFRDILKGLGLGVIVVLPFSPITLPLVFKLAKLLGVDIMPSAFNRMSDSQIKSGRSPE
jgi:RNase P/RNase MRP subunit p30